MACDKYFCGNVIAQYHDNIIIIEGATIKSHEYIVPKSKVDHYDGNDLYLNITRDDMILNFDFWNISSGYFLQNRRDALITVNGKSLVFNTPFLLESESLSLITIGYSRKIRTINISYTLF